MIEDWIHVKHDAGTNNFHFRYRCRGKGDGAVSFDIRDELFANQRISSWVSTKSN